MNAQEIIDAVICRHEDDDASKINLLDDLYLLPKLNHDGRMSVNAYRYSNFKRAWRKWRRTTNAGRRFVGILDFQIMDTQQPDGKMRHDVLLRDVLTLLNSNIICDLHDGKDPLKMGLNEAQIQVAYVLLCAFVEQEANWGINNFQLHTHFGNTEFMYKTEEKCPYLSNAVPRDFLCSHVLYLFNQLLQQDTNIDIVLEKFIKKFVRGTETAGSTTIMPAIDNAKERIMISHRDFMLSYSDESVQSWINPFLDRTSNLCDKIGPNPRWGKFYEIDEYDNVKIKMGHPLKEEGLRWPSISLKK